MLEATSLAAQPIYAEGRSTLAFPFYYLYMANATAKSPRPGAVVAAWRHYAGVIRNAGHNAHENPRRRGGRQLRLRFCVLDQRHTMIHPDETMLTHR